MYIPTSKKYFVYLECVDGRKSFNGLSGLVKNDLSRDPVSGDMLIFLNRSRSRIKLLFWEHGGFGLYYKKMDQGRFEVPPLRADGQATFISEIQVLQVVRDVEFQKEKPRNKSAKKKVLALEK